MAEIAYVNGAFVPLAEAVVSVEDSGFQFADGVYEVVIVYGAEAFRLDAHLARLRRSLHLIDMEVDFEAFGLESVIREGVARAGFDETLVYLQITRGGQPRAHVYDRNIAPTVVATFKRKRALDVRLRERGIALTTVEDFRWSRCEIKSIGLLPNVIAKNRAVRDGFDDALFVGPDGCIREATSANVFAIAGGALITPATDASILHGVTRGYVLECAAGAGIACREAALTVEVLQSANEAFISSTTVDILPIRTIDGRTVGSRVPGPITKRLYEAFLDGLPGVRQSL